MVFLWCRSWCDYKENNNGGFGKEEENGLLRASSIWRPCGATEGAQGLRWRHGKPQELPGESGYPRTQGRTLQCECNAGCQCCDMATKVRPEKLRELPTSGGSAATRPSLPLEAAQGLSVRCPHTAEFGLCKHSRRTLWIRVCMPKTSTAHKTSCQLTPGIRKRNRSLTVSRLGDRKARRKDLKPERTDQVFRKQKRRKSYVWFKTVLNQLIRPFSWEHT